MSIASHLSKILPGKPLPERLCYRCHELIGEGEPRHTDTVSGTHKFWFCMKCTNEKHPNLYP